MGKITFLEKLFNIKHWVYKLVLPIYLWSVGYKTLDSYLQEVEDQVIFEVFSLLNRWAVEENIKDKSGEIVSFSLDNERFRPVKR